MSGIEQRDGCATQAGDAWNQAAELDLAITSYIERALKAQTSPARLLQLAHALDVTDEAHDALDDLAGPVGDTPERVEALAGLVALLESVAGALGILEPGSIPSLGSGVSGRG